MSQTTTRRSVLAGIAAAPIAAAPLPALADTELLALGARLEEAWVRLADAKARHDVVHDRVHEAAENARTWPEDHKLWTLADFDAQSAAVRKAEAEVGGAEYLAAVNAMADRYGECDGIVQAIELRP